MLSPVCTGWDCLRLKFSPTSQDDTHLMNSLPVLSLWAENS
uniref:Uncharacterized protein n=1 Tax=Trichinella nativa TaxID=6335 RepID=A0A0V1KI63_9BILA